MKIKALITVQLLCITISYCDQSSRSQVHQKLNDNPESQYLLGIRYSKGIEVPLSYRKAQHHFESAANKGSTNAQYQLGLMYCRGRGVDIDFKRAFHWFLKAANKNHPLCQACIGVMYNRGIGVQECKIKSYAWTSLAKTNGYVYPGFNMKASTNNMTRTEITEGQSLAIELFNRISPHSLIVHSEVKQKNKP
jgi:TPR repeat protein